MNYRSGAAPLSKHGSGGEGGLWMWRVPQRTVILALEAEMGLMEEFGRRAWRLVQDTRRSIQERKQRRQEYIRRYGSDDDLLVRDPVCGVYIPKSQATVSRINGKWYHFCSRECMVKFRQERLNKDQDPA
ncbi:YHS domain-containing protein [bacterium]|nr:YHS domain-containing protein [candidate division CSSED10-310 bacterium]